MNARLASLVIALSLATSLMLAGSAAVALAGRTERTEWGLFAVAFAAVLPAVLLAASRLRRERRATGARAAAWAGAAVLLVLGARALHALELDGRGAAACVLVAALFACAAMVAPLELPRAPRRRVAAGLVPAFAAATVALLVLCFVPAGLLTPVNLSVAVAIGCAAAFVYARGIGRMPPLRARAALAIDVLVSAFLVLLVVDVVGWTADGPRLSSGFGIGEAVVVPAAQGHLNFYLGPVNDVLHGRTLLVDAVSQYGVLDIYALAAWSELTRLGYGPLALLVCLLTAAQYVAAYWIVRLARGGPMTAAAALLVAVVVAVLAGYGSPAFFPSTGGLRFGLAFLLVLIAVVSARRSPGANPLPVAGLVVVGVAALWSFETLVYALAGAVAIAALDAAIRAPSLEEAARLGGRHLTRLGLAVVAAHVVFAVATLALGGSWPDWGWYVDYLREYSRAGLWTAPASPWSPVWVVGATYLVSLAVVATLVAARRELAVRERVPLIAVTGTAAIGVAFLPYFVGRSFDPLLGFVALPAFVLVAIGLSLILREAAVTAPAKRAAVGFCAGMGALLLALAGPLAGDRLPRTAWAHLPPGGRSLGDALERLWDSPAMDPRSPAGARLADRHLPPSRRALVIAEPDLAEEILLRTDRSDTLPISFPRQDDLLAGRSVTEVREAAARLRAGSLMLFQPDAERRLRERPPVGVVAVVGGDRLSRVQLEALRAIRERFELEPVAAGGAGFRVVRLVPRR